MTKLSKAVAATGVVLLSLLMGVLVASVFVALSSALPRLLEAQAPRPHPSSDPAAVAIYERYLRAVGDASPPEFQHSIQEMQMGAGPAMRIETLTAQPNKVLMRQFMGTDLILEFGFDGTTGWSSSPMTGVVRLSGPELEMMRAGASSVVTPSVDSTMRLIAVGPRTLDNEPVDAILVISTDGDSLETYYAPATGLFVGARNKSKSGLAGAGPDSSVILLRDYKRIEGRMVYTTMIVRMAGMEMVSRTVHLSYAPIDPVKFKPPALAP